jgi:hypothetical protein
MGRGFQASRIHTRDGGDLEDMGGVETAINAGPTPWTAIADPENDGNPQQLPPPPNGGEQPPGQAQAQNALPNRGADRGKRGQIPQKRWNNRFDR